MMSSPSAPNPGQVSTNLPNAGHVAISIPDAEPLQDSATPAAVSAPFTLAERALFFSGFMSVISMTGFLLSSNTFDATRSLSEFALTIAVIFLIILLAKWKDSYIFHSFGLVISLQLLTWASFVTRNAKDQPKCYAQYLLAVFYVCVLLCLVKQYWKPISGNGKKFAKSCWEKFGRERSTIPIKDYDASISRLEDMARELDQGYEFAKKRWEDNLNREYAETRKRKMAKAP